MVLGLYSGPFRVYVYGIVPPLEIRTSNIPFAIPHVVPVTEDVTLYKFTEDIMV